MRILYLDCFSGIAGDMLLGALLDLGLPIGELRESLSALPLKGYSLSASRTVRQGISGVAFNVRVKGRHEHRGWKEIRRIIEAAGLPHRIASRALTIFRRLIEVEARIHHIPVEKVHLHEVGAVDAIVDIVGGVIGLERILGPGGRLHVSPLHLGGGKVEMEHGTYPVPPPATVALLKGVPVLSGPVDGELVTPTGAAIVSTLADAFGPMPPLTIERTGYGAGTRSYEGHPNVLRAVLGSAEDAAESLDEVVVAECNIDDMNPQAYGYLMERLFGAGALEVFYTPVFMKKGRPGTLVTVIGPQERFGDLVSVLFRESTTIGLRHRTMKRIELSRELRTVRTPFGRVRVKVSSFAGSPVQAQPEYEDCRRLAAARKVPLKEVQAVALAAIRETSPATTAGSKSPARGVRAGRTRWTAPPRKAPAASRRRAAARGNGRRRRRS